MDNTTYTTAEAAALLGLKTVSVRAHIAHGLLRAEKRGRDYLISADEIERFRSARRPRGRPTMMTDDT